jgi:hypothetical protein
MNVNPLPRQPTSDGAIPRCKVDDREGIQHALQERGCCICTSVASSTERKEGVKLFWNYVENLNVGVTRGRADTMGNSTWNRLCFPKNGVIAGGGIGQSDFMWHCRLLPNVRKCFQHAWGGDRDLITSFDGCGAYRNPWSSFESTEDWTTTGGWFHLDQGPDNPGLTSYQGLLNFFPATAATGSTVLVPGSHHHFATVLKDARRSVKDVRQGSVSYVKLTQPGDYAKYCSGAVQVEMEAGDLLLWDSRTIHCAQGVDIEAGRDAAMGFPGASEKVKTRLLARLVAYMCMVPRNHQRRSRGCRDLRQEFVRRGMTSGHNPLVKNVGILGGENPHYQCPPPDSPRWELV